MLSTTIGVNVKMSRLELGWSQERLAFASGVCVRTISAIECGAANPTSDVIESLAWALGVPVSRLVG
ncbi:helix-turn-helix transcriptional regulator [Anaerotruncus massiliensis (ex Togo et al. 2019)]|uniref:helix-turn-helix domain-containing protein n=1 Tax=Anaerotruncus TaxID=244127 RepID=UPI0033903453